MVAADYAYLGVNQDETETPMLVMVDSETGMVFAHIVSKKGPDPEVINQVLSDMEILGHRDIVFKSDQEPAMVAVQQEIRLRRPGTALENSAIGESETNGMVENAIRRVTGLTRTLKSALESRIGKQVPNNSSVIPWLVNHAANIINYFGIGEDGKTPMQKAKGVNNVRELPEFGELVLYIPSGARAAKSKMDARWEFGVFLGVSPRSSEVLVENNGQVSRVWSIRRLPEDRRWDVEAILRNKEAPVRGAEIKVTMEEMAPIAPPPPRPETILDFAVRAKDIAAYGFTPGCKGCRAMWTGGRQQAHDASCRKRIMETLMKTTEGQDRIKLDKERQDHKKAKRGDDIKKEGGKSTQDQEVTHDVQHDENMDADREPEKRKQETREQEETGESSRKAARLGGDSARRPPEEKREGSSSSSSSSSSSTSPSSSPPHSGNQQSHSAPNQPSHNPLPSSTPDHSESSKHLNKHDMEDKDDVAEPESKKARHDNRGIETVDIEGGIRVFDIFSPPRTSDAAEQMGCRSGWAVDRRAPREDGEAWDLTCPRHQEEVIDTIRNERPTLTVISPPCTEHRQGQATNKNKESPAEWGQTVKESDEMLRFAVQVARLQMENGKYFLLELPRHTTSWSRPWVRRLVNEDGVFVTDLDMCQFNMTLHDESGPGFIKKPTRTITNSMHIAKMVSKKCHGGHRHVNAESERKCSRAATYPKDFCVTVCQAIMDQEIYDQQNSDLNYIIGDKFFDEITGKELDNAKVAEARRLELEYFDKMGVFELWDRREAVAKFDTWPISVKWVDVEKSSGIHRSRLVARELKTHEDSELYAATPPIEVIKMQIAEAAHRTANLPRGSDPSDDWVLVHADVHRAYFYAPVQRDILVDLPKELREKYPTKCARLKKSMYGTRGAAKAWEAEYVRILTEMGYTQGEATTCAFVNKENNSIVIVHGDDFLCLARRKDADQFVKDMAKKFDIEVQLMGPRDNDPKVMRMLNRTLQWHGDRISYRADRKHATQLVALIPPGGKQEAKVPITSELMKENEGGQEEQMTGAEGTQYRAAAARTNFLSIDRPDLLFAARTASKYMAAPVRDNMKLIEKSG